jgi:predicted DNA-binding transcriptional regulator AlpA
MLNVNPLLTARQVAQYTGLKASTLRDERFRMRHGLAVVKLGRRAIRFRAEDVQRWILRNVDDPSVNKEPTQDEQRAAGNIPHA